MSKRASTSRCTSTSDGGGGGGPSGPSGPSGGTLTGMGAVEHVFHFLDGPADVLSAVAAGVGLAFYARIFALKVA